MALLTCAVLAVAAPAWAVGPGDPAYIPPGKTLVIVGQQNPAVHEAYTSGVGIEPAGLMYYAGLEWAPRDFRGNLTWIQQDLDRHSEAALQLGLTMGYSPVWSTLGGNPQLPGAVKVAAGVYDQQLRQLAEWLNGLGDRPVFIRVGYEFDLLGGQWGTPAQYKAAYRHIVDLLRRRGVDNAAYVWHSAGAFFRTADYSGLAGLLGTLDRTGGALDPVVNGSTALLRQGARLTGTEPDLLPIRAFYPGPGYVDYFGISYWDDACCFGRSSADARDIYRQRTRELLRQARAMGLPLMMAETTPAYIGADSGAPSLTWIRRYFGLIERFDMRATAYIDPDWPSIDNGFWGSPYWGHFWPDARIEANAGTCHLWLEEIAKSRYVNGPVAPSGPTGPCA